MADRRQPEPALRQRAVGHCCCKPPEPPKPKKKSLLAKICELLTCLIKIALPAAVGGPPAINLCLDILPTRLGGYGHYWNYARTVDNFKLAVKSIARAAKSDARTETIIFTTDATAVINIVPLPNPKKHSVGFPLGDYGFESAVDSGLATPRKRKSRRSKRGKGRQKNKCYRAHPKPNELALFMRVLSVFEKQLKKYRVDLEPCTIDLTVEGFSDGHPVKRSTRYCGRKVVRRYLDEEPCCAWHEIHPDQRINNFDIAFLRAHYVELFIRESDLNRYIRDSDIYVRENCERGGCFRKVKVTIHFEDLFKVEFNRLSVGTRWLIYVGLLNPERWAENNRS